MNHYDKNQNSIIRSFCTINLFLRALKIAAYTWRTTKNTSKNKNTLKGKKGRLLFYIIYEVQNNNCRYCGLRSKKV